MPAEPVGICSPSAADDPLSRRASEAFDPRGILNPGILGSERPHDASATGTPLAVPLPGVEQCVHCGFCLQACPTYLALEDENDSPRGRIVLMRALRRRHARARRRQRSRRTSTAAWAAARARPRVRRAFRTAQHSRLLARPAGARSRRAPGAGRRAPAVVRPSRARSCSRCRHCVFARHVLARGSRGSSRALGFAMAMLASTSAALRSERVRGTRRRLAREGGAAAGLRDGGLFAHVESRDRAHARRERLHHRAAPGAQLLRRAARARRRRARRARARHGEHRRVRAERRGVHRRERRGLRRDDEGVRRTCSPPIRNGRARRARSQRRCET